ncbi:PHP domain-containing protein [Sinomonas sp. R1AF57]|uniref:helix-hairpin-helix domain-containing protein n=1 Tax=Sinomonas sp. R1AF57 TaxID=2020377 RepID=UPI001ABFEB6E|nr:PHP domain-containing protein [Sinomonas sp. R1AF57]
MAPFTHLHAAGAFSPGHGTSWPEDFAEAAAADGAAALAVTDRDGLYGALRHVRACLGHGLGAIVGVDLAVLAEDPAHDGASVPGRGGAGVAGRVVVLARGGNGGAGWAALCRLVSDAHAHTGRKPKGTVPVGVLRSELAARCLDRRSGRPVLTVLIGPDSDVGRAMHGPRFLRPRTLFREWLEALPPGVAAVELVAPADGEAEAPIAGGTVRMLRLAAEHGIPAVLTNAARAAVPGDEGVGASWLKPAGLMHEAARRIITAAGLGPADLGNLLSNTESIAGRCRLDPGPDLGWGAIGAAAAVADDVAQTLRELDVRFAPWDAGSGLPGHGFDVEAAQVERVFRRVVARFGPDRAVLAAAPHGAPATTAAAPAPPACGQPELLPAARPAQGPVPADPVGIVLGDAGLLGRVPVQPSRLGLPAAQFAPEDLAFLGLGPVGLRGSALLDIVAYADADARRMGGAGLGPEAAGTAADDQARWLEEHHPEAFLAARLEHCRDPRSQRDLRAEAENLGIPLLPVDVALSGAGHRVERVAAGPEEGRLGVRLPLGSVPGLSRGDVGRLVAGQPYASIAEVRERARLSPSALRRLADAGALDALHRAAASAGTHADVVAHLAELVSTPSGRTTPPVTGQLALELA